MRQNASVIMGLWGVVADLLPPVLWTTNHAGPTTATMGYAPDQGCCGPGRRGCCATSGVRFRGRLIAAVPGWGGSSRALLRLPHRGRLIAAVPGWGGSS